MWQLPYRILPGLCSHVCVLHHLLYFKWTGHWLGSKSLPILLKLLKNLIVESKYDFSLYNDIWIFNCCSPTIVQKLQILMLNKEAITYIKWLIMKILWHRVLWNFGPDFVVLKSVGHIKLLWHGFTELSLQTPLAVKLIHFTHLHLSEGRGKVATQNCHSHQLCVPDLAPLTRRK